MGGKGGGGWGKSGGKGGGKEMMQMLKKMQGGKGGMGGGAWGKGGGGPKTDPDCTVWVGSIPEGIPPEEMEANFKDAGKIVFFKSMGSGKSAKVQYSTKEEAQKAITMFNGCEINGTAIVVDPWTK